MTYVKPEIPFVWYGSKRRWADEIRRRIGTVDVWLEGFAGSLACLLARPPAKQEIVADMDFALVNFWRAVQSDPDAVARWADAPTHHLTLTARLRWLIRWRAEEAPRLAEDPEWSDPRAAGYWAWGQSVSIGPLMYRTPGSIPNVIPGGGGKGVAAQRGDLPGPVGKGVRLRAWMLELAERLDRVTVLARPWRSVTSPTMTGWTRNGPRGRVGILLDPPYLTGDRKADLYDGEIESDMAAVESYEWAVANGGWYRICYCAHAGDFPAPPGWTSMTSVFKGIRRPDRRHRRDMIMFSPACRPDPE